MIKAIIFLFALAFIFLFALALVGLLAAFIERGRRL
jgi:hypothetical protein